MSNPDLHATHRWLADRLSRAGLSLPNLDLDPAPALIPPTRHLPAETGPDAVADLEPLPDVDPPVAGRALGRYQQIADLALGGMGAILTGRDPDLNRTVAIKVLHPGSEGSGEALQKFMVEAQVTGQLEHPNIVPVHELGVSPDGIPYIAMKRVRGGSLADALAGRREAWERDPGTFTLGRYLRAFLKVCEAMAFAHARGVVHRDLKPDNIMIGEFGEVLVMDWGLARIRGLDDVRAGSLQVDLSSISDRHQPTAGSPLQTLDGTVMGTPAYMPPEQAAGAVHRIDARSDVYALGAILYQILTGSPPYTDPNLFAILDQIQAGDLEPPSARAPSASIPRELEAVVLKAMAHRPRQRYGDVEALAADIEAYLEGRTLSAARYNPLQRLGKWVTRNRAVSITVAIALSLAAAALLGQRWRSARAFADQVGALRATVAERTSRADALPLPRRLANGELTREALEDWMAAQAARLDAYDRLAAVAARAPTAAALRALDLSSIDDARRQLSVRCARLASDLGEYALAQVWIARAHTAGLAESEWTAERDRIARTRAQRIKTDLQTARTILDRYGTGRQTEWLLRAVSELHRLRSPDLVRMLLAPEWLERGLAPRRQIVIRTLGRIGDTRTARASDGQPLLPVMHALLERIDIDAEMSVAAEISWVLALLGDAGSLEAMRAACGRNGAFASRIENHVYSLSDRLGRAAPPPRPELPDSAEEIKREMSRMVDLRKWPRAVTLARKLNALGPDPQAYDVLVGECNRRKQHVKAQALLDEWIARCPTMGAYLRRGNLRQDYLNDPRGAVADYEWVLRQYGPRLSRHDLGMVHANRGNARKRIGDLTGANADYDRAIELNPKQAFNWMHRGMLRGAQGRLSGALEDLEVALRLDSRSYLIRSNHARLRLAAGDLARRQGEETVARQHYTRALQDATLALERRPEYSAAIGILGEAHLRLGNTRAAIATADTVLRRAPEDPVALRMRAQAYLASKRTDDAIRDLRVVARRAPRDWRAAWILGDALRTSGDTAGATQAYRRARAAAPAKVHAQLDARLRAVGAR